MIISSQVLCRKDKDANFGDRVQNCGECELGIDSEIGEMGCGELWAQGSFRINLFSYLKMFGFTILQCQSSCSKCACFCQCLMFLEFHGCFGISYAAMSSPAF